MTRTHTQRLARLEKLAHSMDSAFRIPVIGMRVGYDAIIGLVPGIGDALTLIPALIILAEAKRLGAAPHVMGRMGLNTALDVLVGSVPVIGDLFDAKFKSNRRNVAILRAHLHEKGAVPERNSPLQTA
ncbi:protein of unknown function [Loktanella sp. DSM 29012]|uniref:DUF4112 domain-containing protein n=1 Tax=Loktanella gaetbuli TaxID=2881335 RepID=A0ABS8BQH9_9RHOB|nr:MULTISPECIES: DUF4112 domain-containing protein [Loktanella]MCB5197985.1 DUF4112 domain-containing protein [Loktanella gaetbuli]SEQ21636.1 protein of unknown function [Loktanella sp. DSM 29012]